MKLKIMTLLACLMSLMGCSAQKSYPSVSVDEFEKITSDPNVIRLDVRTSEEYAEGHIAMAINIDVKETEFEDKAKATLDKSKTIAVYCRSGNRSKKACDILTANGFKVIELAPGITGFDEKTKGATFILTGEGKSDKQTLMGKVPEGILKRAIKQNIPVHLLSGAIENPTELKEAGFASVRSINENDNRPLEILMQKEVAMNSYTTARLGVVFTISPDHIPNAYGSFLILPSIQNADSPFAWSNHLPIQSRFP